MSTARYLNRETGYVYGSLEDLQADYNHCTNNGANPQAWTTIEEWDPYDEPADDFDHREHMLEGFEIVTEEELSELEKEGEFIERLY